MSTSCTCISASTHNKKKRHASPSPLPVSASVLSSLSIPPKKNEEMHWRPQNTDTKKTPEYAGILLASKHLPHNLHFTCQVVNCHCHWRYAQCQGRVQDLQAEEARHGGNNQPRVQHGPTACYGCYGDLLMPYEKHTTMLMASSG